MRSRRKIVPSMAVRRVILVHTPPNAKAAPHAVSIQKLTPKLTLLPT